eukprot:gene7010-7754_t
MPNVHFVGEISFIVSSLSAVCITWAIVPGNDAWVLKNGMNYGESHVALTQAESGQAVISHPIDVHFQASTSEGWPFFIFEIWDCQFPNMKGFRGCGCIWLPSQPGVHSLDANAWMPISDGLAALKGKQQL